MKLRIGRYDLDGEIAAIERVVAGVAADDLDGRRQRRVHPRRRAAASETARGARLPLARGAAADVATTRPTRRSRGTSRSRSPVARSSNRPTRRRPTSPAGRSTSSSRTCRSAAGSAASSRSRGSPAAAGRVDRPARVQWRDRDGRHAPGPGRARRARRCARLGRAAPRVRRRRKPDPDRTCRRRRSALKTAGWRSPTGRVSASTSTRPRYAGSPLRPEMGGTHDQAPAR